MRSYLFSVFVSVSASASESVNYSLTPLAIDGGGGRSTSANYSLDSSVTSGGRSSTPDYTSRSGYAGSLFDVLALALSDSPFTVNEGETRQLGAALLLDDSSALALAPAVVTWSVQSGPLTGISGGGLATAGIVYQDTNAFARGSYQSFIDTVTLNVLNVNADDFGLYAGDGIADDWQVLYFGTENDNAAPLLDPDHDGWINLFEFHAGLAPTDPFSAFHLREELVDGQPGQRRIIFSPRLAGHTYSVEFSTTLAPGSWQPLMDATVADNGDERTVTDPDAAGPRKFYRVGVQRP